MTKTAATAIVLAALLSSSCKGPPCRTQTDCDFGAYCQLEASSGLGSGSCQKDCEQNSDCPQPNLNISYAVCSNQGRCETLDRPPKLRILEPEEATHFPEGTRTIRITGEIQSAAPTVTVTAHAKNDNGCGGGIDRAMDLMNPTPGTFATLSFILEDVDLDPGQSKLIIDAHAGAGEKSTTVNVEVDCPGCAAIQISSPKGLASAPALELPHLTGAIMPDSIKRAIWRIFSSEGDVIDGSLPVNNGSFGIDRLPIFPGLNHVEVIVTGVGTGLGEARCSSLVSAGTTRETGIRLVLLGDDPEGDIDTHVIGPNGVFGDAMNSLSPRSEHPSFGGSVIEDIDGPEVTSVPMPPDGVYGVVVEPVIDGSNEGSNAVIHALFDGRLATPRPIGPRHLTANDGKLWVVGTIKIEQGSAVWTTIDQLIDADMTPTTFPSDWPRFQ